MRVCQNKCLIDDGVNEEEALYNTGSPLRLLCHQSEIFLAHTVIFCNLNFSACQ